MTPAQLILARIAALAALLVAHGLAARRAGFCARQAAGHEAHAADGRTAPGHARRLARGWRDEAGVWFAIATLAAMAAGAAAVLSPGGA
ncbi:MAG: hypothetical protein ACOYM5_02920 [Caulobacter sp.]